MKNFTAVVLAAGKGTRFNATTINKVMHPLCGKPMLWYTLNLLKKVGFNKIIIVVGFAKESIITYFGPKYIYVEQAKRLGTAHALKCALPKISQEINDVFVCYSDDTAFYTPEIIKKLIKQHEQDSASITILTVDKRDPAGLGRVIRNREGEIMGIVEEKNTTLQEKKIKEINTGCYCFKVDFLKKYLPQVKMNPVTHEFYLPDLVALAIEFKEKLTALKMSKEEYFEGVNTKEQLVKANCKMQEKFKHEPK
jgi:UDP-N-acetylglucosamine diphosphorylase/glucosamine-1-phosphate N-acetyltransferase